MNRSGRKSSAMKDDLKVRKKEKQQLKNAEKYCQQMMMRDLRRMDEIRKEELKTKIQKNYPHTHPDMLPPDDLSENFQNLLSEMEQGKTHNGVATEKFGGLPLGYSGYPPVTPPEYKYYGLNVCQQMKSFVPDYPDDLHMHQVCVPRDKNLRQTVDNYLTYPVPSYTPPIQFATPSSSLGSIAPSIKSTHSMLVFFGKAPLTAPKEQPPIVSTSDADAYNYLDYYSIDVLFEYIISLLLKRKPADPFVFIKKLLKTLLQARNDAKIFSRLPRMFKKAHVKNLFQVYDKFRKGTLTVFQYKSGMETLGLYRYKPDPDGFRHNEISEATFVHEAVDAMNSHIRSFLVLPPGKKKEDLVLEYALAGAQDNDILTDAESLPDIGRANRGSEQGDSPPPTYAGRGSY